MNNIELYREIEKLVDKAFWWYPFDMESMMYRDKKILHYLQLGEDAIPLLEQQIRTIQENREANRRTEESGAGTQGRPNTMRRRM